MDQRMGLLRLMDQHPVGTPPPTSPPKKKDAFTVEEEWADVRPPPRPLMERIHNYRGIKCVFALKTESHLSVLVL